MDRMQKRPFLVIILLAILASGIISIALCSHLCPSGSHGFDFHQHGRCSVQSHSFTNVGMGLPLLFVLPLMGLFLLLDVIFSPQELILLPFKPPRFNSSILATGFIKPE